MKERRTGRVNRIIATERLSEISSASFQTESVDFSRGSLQFSNGFSWKLLFHLSFNRNARRLWRPVLQIEEGTYWGQSTNENYTLSLFQKKKHTATSSRSVSKNFWKSHLLNSDKTWSSSFSEKTSLKNLMLLSKLSRPILGHKMKEISVLQGINSFCCTQK